MKKQKAKRKKKVVLWVPVHRAVPARDCAATSKEQAVQRFEMEFAVDWPRGRRFGWRIVKLEGWV